MHSIKVLQSSKLNHSSDYIEQENEDKLTALEAVSERKSSVSAIKSSSSLNGSYSSLSTLELPSLPPELMGLLLTLPFFSKVTPSEGFLTEISHYLRVRKCGPQEIILKHGDMAKAMFFVIKGSLSVTSADREVEFSELESGSFCKEYLTIKLVKLVFYIMFKELPPS